MRRKGQTAATARAYAYNSQKPAHAPLRMVAGGVTQSFAYDASGNMTTGLSGKTMTHDGENAALVDAHALGIPIGGRIAIVECSKNAP